MQDSVIETAVKGLDVFENPYRHRGYKIETIQPEFTSICPKTGRPDFATLTLTYHPDEYCLELKSLKLYLEKFRNEGVFYERLTNMLLDDFVAACKPKWMEVKMSFTPRGGISTNITAHYSRHA